MLELLGMILSLAINPEGIDLTPKELAKDTRDAIQNIEYGLRHWSRRSSTMFRND